MALYVNTNVSSLNSQRKLANATNSLNVSYQRLASGLRINSARDDAAGLQISDRLTAQINGLDQGNRNTNDGIALCQTVEGALEETTNMLQRIRVLAVQAANGTYSSQDRQALQEEVTQLSTEIMRIAQKTNFAGAQILDGAPEKDNQANNMVPNIDAGPGIAGIVQFQVGANANDTIGLDLNTAFKLSTMFAGQGQTVMLVPPHNDNKNYTPGNVDFSEAWNLAIEDATVQGTQPQNLIGLVATATRLDGSKGNFNSANDFQGGARWSISTAQMAQATLGSIDSILTFVDSKRAELGALQNRMEATIRNQSNISENESDARSRIRDTDFAEETARLTANNIIQNASQTILAQANQRPQIAMQLLQAGQ